MNAIRPYVELSRVHKPAGGFFFLWPMLWGLAMAAYSKRTPYPEFIWLSLKTLFGALILRSSACTVNDIFDKDIDAKVERTKSRPLASGRISTSSAVVFLVTQLVIGGIFFASYNEHVFWLAMLEMIPLMSIYPLIKRVSYWPQAWLGIAINVGFALSWFQITSDSNGISHVVPIMTLGLWSWTMMYDTVYGCQDKIDDVKAGVLSSSLFFGDSVWTASALFDTIFVACLGYAGLINRHGSVYFVISVLGSAFQLAYQLVKLDINSPSSCWDNFKNNAFYLGPQVFAGIVLDYVYRMHYGE